MYNNQHFIDAFYRVHGHHHEDDEPAEPRSAEKETINQTEKGEWDADKKKIINVAPGKEPGDAVIVGQALVRDGCTFKVGKSKYDFMASDNEKWNAKKRKLAELGVGEAESDAVTMGQIIKVDDD